VRMVIRHPQAGDDATPPGISGHTRAVPWLRVEESITVVSCVALGMVVFIGICVSPVALDNSHQ
jgi:hypothetical protein